MKKYVIFQITLLFLLSSGCSSYKSSGIAEKPAHLETHHKNKEGLCLAAKDYSDAKLCQLYLGLDLRKEGIIPIFLAAENQGEGVFEILNQKDRISLRLFNGSSLSPLNIDNVLQTVGGGRDIETDYRAKCFGNILMHKGDNINGFIFFPAPDNSQSNKDLLPDHLEVVVVKQGKTENDYAQNIIFKLPFK